MLLSLLDKAYAIVAPALFLVLDLWPLRRWEPREPRTLALLALEKLPFALLSVAGGARAWWAKSSAADSMRSLSEHGLGERALQASFGLAFYARKTLVPADLSPMVDLPSRILWSDPRFLVPALGVALLSLVLLIAACERALALAPGQPKATARLEFPCSVGG